jgi:hypothetical protein
MRKRENNWPENLEDRTPEQHAEIKRWLIELAKSGAPRPRIDALDPEERRLARALEAYTTPPPDLN